MLANWRVLLTGGAGFIGSNILKTIYLEVKSIRMVDNLSTGNLKNIPESDKIEFVWGDIMDLETCRKVTKDIDIICHQAALGSVPRSIKDPLMVHKNNVDGFMNILIAAKENKVRRIVYASSSSVYGDDKELPKRENKIGESMSPYAATKLINEIYAKVFYKCYGIEIIGLRYFNVFGPNQNPNGEYAAVVPRFIKALKDNNAPIINGTGEYSRDFTYVANVVYANILAMKTNNKECYGKVLNIANGGQITINQLYETISRELKKNIKPQYITTRDGDIPHSNADITLARELLNYEPIVTFEDGIRRTINKIDGGALLQ